MRTTRTHSSKYFYGHKISDYGIESGYLDYQTLAQAFDAVLANDLMEKTWDTGYWEQINGYPDYEDEITELEEKIKELENELAATDADGDGRREDIQMEIDAARREIDEYQNMMDYPPEIYQYFVVSCRGAEIIQEYTDDPIFYNEELGLCVWGVCHWGTSWDYVLTDVKLCFDDNGEDD